jgi:hypothetical protein
MHNLHNRDVPMQERDRNELFRGEVCQRHAT